MADAKPDDIKDLLGGALFKALYKWMEETGPVYLLPTGPVSSFLVVSDPAAARHVLQRSDNPKNNVYGKGLVAEVSKFLFGDGFATSGAPTSSTEALTLVPGVYMHHNVSAVCRVPFALSHCRHSSCVLTLTEADWCGAGGEEWRVRRKAVGPSMHRAYLAVMLDRVFGESALHLNSKLEVAAASGSAVNIEASFSQLTLDVIGKAVFNYDFDALNNDSAIIQAVYTALKETESRATDLLPFWKIPGSDFVVPRQRRAVAAVREIRATTEMLIARCKQMVDDEEQAAASQEEEYINAEDPSILRFLIASRDEVSASQLRDDLLGMLVAGHETTASVLTWTIFLLAQSPTHMRKVQVRTYTPTVRPAVAGLLRTVLRRRLLCILYARKLPSSRAYGALVGRLRACCAMHAHLCTVACARCTSVHCSQEEVDRVMGDGTKPTFEQYRELQFTLRCINESMRLYPHPPVLLRRALVEDELPGGYTVPKEQDVMISVYNIHRSPAVWDEPNEFKPERFPLDAPPPTEINTDFRCVRRLCRTDAESSEIGRLKLVACTG